MLLTSQLVLKVHSSLMLLKTTRSISLNEEMNLPRASSPKQRALSTIDTLRATVALGVRDVRLRLAQVITPAPAGHSTNVWDDFLDEGDF